MPGMQLRISQNTWTLVVKHWLEREIVQWVHHEGSIRRPISLIYLLLLLLLRIYVYYEFKKSVIRNSYLNKSRLINIPHLSHQGSRLCVGSVWFSFGLPPPPPDGVGTFLCRSWNINTQNQDRAKGGDHSNPTM